MNLYSLQTKMYYPIEDIHTFVNQNHFDKFIQWNIDFMSTSANWSAIGRQIITITKLVRVVALC